MGEVVSFEVISTKSAKDYTELRLHFGDSLSVDLLQTANPFYHKYRYEGGLYFPRLSYKLKGGKRRFTEQLRVYVYDPGEIRLRVADDSLCHGDTLLAYCPKETSTGERIISFHWQPGDGFQSSKRQIKHLYRYDGNYEIELLAEISNGCELITKDSVWVRKMPIIDFEANNTEFWPGNNRVVLYNKTGIAYENVDSFHWISGSSRGDPISGPTNWDSIAFEMIDGYRSPKLFIKTKFGCKDSLKKVDFIRAGSVRFDISWVQSISKHELIAFKKPLPNATGHKFIFRDSCGYANKRINRMSWQPRFPVSIPGYAKLKLKIWEPPIPHSIDTILWVKGIQGPFANINLEG